MLYNIARRRRLGRLTALAEEGPPCDIHTIHNNNIKCDVTMTAVRPKASWACTCQYGRPMIRANFEFRAFF